MKKQAKAKKDYSWDLDAILGGITLERLHAQWKDACEGAISAYAKGKCFAAPGAFGSFLAASKKFTLLSNRLTNYVHNNLNEDIANPKWNEWRQKIALESAGFAARMSDLPNAIIKNRARIERHLALPRFREWRRHFELTFREQGHLLSDAEEKLLSRLAILNPAAGDVFDTLTRSEIRFADAVSSRGARRKIKTLADVPPLLQSRDRELRKSAWLSRFNAYYAYKETLAKTLYHAYLNFNTNAKIRKHRDYVSQTAFEDEIPVSFIRSVYDNVARFAPLAKRFSSIVRTAARKRLGLKKVEPWDTQVPLFRSAKKYTIEDAQRIALEALAPMGEAYGNMVKKAFSERWISWLPKPGKQTGAYSIGNAEGLPKYYISMNFDGTLRSVYTIVHELGHSMHTWKLLENQKIYTDVSIFYAEISSIANEMLLNHHLLERHKNDPKTKITVLIEMIQNFFATTTRQIMFSDFEHAANERINAGEEFSSSAAFDLYARMHEKYLGYSKKAVEGLKRGNLRKSLSIIVSVPHFYAGIFYVYKYAVGQIAAIVAIKRVMEKKPKALEDFMGFMASGNSLPPLDTIKLLGVDLTRREPWDEAYAIVSGWIDALRAELKKTKLA